MPRRGRRGAGISRVTASQVRSREYRQNTLQNLGENFRNLQIKFEDDLQKLQSYTCKNCSRTLIQEKIFEICTQCRRNPSKFTAANHMDPKDVPIELKDLSYVEQLLISRVQPVMRVYRVKSRGFPGHYF